MYILNIYLFAQIKCFIKCRSSRAFYLHKLVRPVIDMHNPGKEMKQLTANIILAALFQNHIISFAK